MHINAITNYQPSLRHITKYNVMNNSNETPELANKIKLHETNTVAVKQRLGPNDTGNAKFTNMCKQTTSNLY